MGGQISQDEYMEYLQKSVQHDTKLLDYFESTGNAAKAKLVKYRIECTNKEMTGDVDPSEME